MLQYDYSWGDEDVLSSSVQVVKETSPSLETVYTITLIQEGFEPLLFSTLFPTKHCELVKRSDTVAEGNCGMTILTTTMKVRAINNPRPETLFNIVPTSAKNIK